MATPTAAPEISPETLPQRLHHYALVVKDQEVNRQFFEDVLGIPLVATWCEHTTNSTTGEPLDFCHTFFEMADGGALAFFQYADDEAYERLRLERPGMMHIAMKIDDSGYDALRGRLDKAKIAYTEQDHGYCKSLYCKSPDGLTVEYTVDPPDVAEVMAVRRGDAHAELARWLGGDRRTNNEIRPEKRG